MTKPDKVLLFSQFLCSNCVFWTLAPKMSSIYKAKESFKMQKKFDIEAAQICQLSIV